uniref:Protein SON n=1 Tax=Suricata suricatta TaxID=37032 RepID=A0A673TQY7_SURSU
MKNKLLIFNTTITYISLITRSLSKKKGDCLEINCLPDRKGLVTVGERAQKRSGNFSAAMKDLSGKHPVSALMEICNKRRWQPPEFLLVHDSGPDHRKHFLFRVLRNGSPCQPNCMFFLNRY